MKSLFNWIISWGRKISEVEEEFERLRVEIADLEAVNEFVSLLLGTGTEGGSRKCGSG